jgi:hypothetical protein
VARRLDADHHAAILLAELHAANRVPDVVHRKAHVAETMIADPVQPVARITAGPIVAGLRRVDLDRKVAMADHRVDRRTVLRMADLEVNAAIVRDRLVAKVALTVIADQPDRIVKAVLTEIVARPDRMVKVVRSVVKLR